MNSAVGAERLLAMNIYAKTHREIETKRKEASRLWRAAQAAEGRIKRELLKRVAELEAEMDKLMQTYAENPFKYWRRPPKGWWRRCTRGVDESARSYGRRVDSARVCGATWARKSDSEKKAVRREAERLEENPCGCWGWSKVFE